MPNQADIERQQEVLEKTVEFIIPRLPGKYHAYQASTTPTRQVPRLQRAFLVLGTKKGMFVDFFGGRILDPMIFVAKLFLPLLFDFQNLVFPSRVDRIIGLMLISNLFPISHLILKI